MRILKFDATQKRTRRYAPQTLVAMPQKHEAWWNQTGTAVSKDGIALSFASGGDKDAPALVCCNGVGVSTFFWQYIGQHFSLDHRVLVWDYRGHGSSGRPRNLRTFSMEQNAEDLIQVLDAAGVERAVLLGHSMGCQVVLETAHRYPDRVDGIIPMLGSYGKVGDTFIDPRFGIHIFETTYKLGTTIPGILSAGMRATLRKPVMWHFARLSGLVHHSNCSRDDLEPYMDHLARLDPEIFFEMARAAHEHDAGQYLEELLMPALVVAGEKDLFTPHHLSLEMAERIPNAELLEIPDGSHAALVEQPELINQRVRTFLEGPVKTYVENKLKSAPEAAAELADGAKAV